LVCSGQLIPDSDLDRFFGKPRFPKHPPTSLSAHAFYCLILTQFPGQGTPALEVHIFLRAALKSGVVLPAAVMAVLSSLFVLPEQGQESEI